MAQDRCRMGATSLANVTCRLSAADRGAAVTKAMKAVRHTAAGPGAKWELRVAILIVTLQAKIAALRGAPRGAIRVSFVAADLVAIGAGIGDLIGDVERLLQFLDFAACTGAMPAARMPCAAFT